MTESQSSAITKKVLTDWLGVNWGNCSFCHSWGQPRRLYHKGIPYVLETTVVDNLFHTYPSLLKSAVSPKDQKLLAEKIFVPFSEWKTKDDQRKEKQKLAQEKRKLQKQIKDFLTAK
jgi:hypothetical protein